MLKRGGDVALINRGPTRADEVLDPMLKLESEHLKDMLGDGVGGGSHGRGMATGDKVRVCKVKGKAEIE